MAQFTNQAQLAFNDSVINSNIAVGEILEVLSATKTAVNAEYGADDSVTYIVSILNSGTAPYSGLTVSDDLGAYAFGEQTLVPLEYVSGTVRYYVNGVLQAAPAVTAGPPLSVTGINVPAGGNAIIIYEADTTEFAPLAAGSTIENTVTVSGDGITPFTAAASVTAASEPELTITKSVSPVPVSENGTLTYTFIIQNTGNTAVTAEDLAVITDSFDPILTNLTVTLDGTALALGDDYTYTVTDGSFATVAGVVTVPAAAYTQDETTGAYITTPGIATLVITGTV